MAVLALAAGCVLEVPDDAVPEPCEVTICSSNAWCSGGTCHCDEGYAGNAHAVDGCRPESPGTSCASGCGDNAWCADDVCQCESGYVAVCDAGGCLAVAYLCDGYDDCAGGEDEHASACVDQAIQDWEVVDGCDDGVDVEWRVWSLERDWVWPSIDEVFVSYGFGVASTEPIQCLDGELVCFGARSMDGELVWGVGLDGTAECDDCCVSCASDVVQWPELRCE
jgi:hypothetical protein